jgi:chromosome partitioning protein
MKVVTVAAPKGGSCKSSTVALLAVRAVQDAKNVCLIDLNPDQASLIRWHAARGTPMNPHLERKIRKLRADVDVIRRSNRFDWLFIDTPPLDMDVIETAVQVANCVVIPVRTSSLDINAIDAIVEMCREREKPYKFLLSAVDTKMSKLTDSAVNALVKHGELFSKRVKYLLPYINAMTAGRTGPEIDHSLQEDTTALWIEVQTLASNTIKPTLRMLQEKRVAANE